jgi:hypothetical protein
MLPRWFCLPRVCLSLRSVATVPKFISLSISLRLYLNNITSLVARSLLVGRKTFAALTRTYRQLECEVQTTVGLQRPNSGSIVFRGLELVGCSDLVETFSRSSAVPDLGPSRGFISKVYYPPEDLSRCQCPFATPSDIMRISRMVDTHTRTHTCIGFL